MDEDKNKELREIDKSLMHIASNLSDISMFLMVIAIASLVSMLIQGCGV